MYPVIIKATPIPTKITQLRGVKIPRNESTDPARMRTCEFPKSCFTRVSPKSFSFEPFVTRIPVDSEISSDGICDVIPSPIVKIPYC